MTDGGREPGFDRDTTLYAGRGTPRAALSLVKLAADALLSPAEGAALVGVEPVPVRPAAEPVVPNTRWHCEIIRATTWLSEEVSDVEKLSSGGCVKLGANTMLRLRDVILFSWEFSETLQVQNNSSSSDNSSTSSSSASSTINSSKMISITRWTQYGRAKQPRATPVGKYFSVVRSVTRSTIYLRGRVAHLTFFEIHTTNPFLRGHP